MKIYTIGVYNLTAERFFDKLTKHKIDTFCDIRQVRGMRGSKYSFVNSNRLQQKLDELGIKYLHIEGLAPTAEVRDLQKNIDKNNGILQSERKELDRSFITGYEKAVLIKFDHKKFMERLNKSGSKNVLFFCVEENYAACHRSIVTKYLHTIYNLGLKHL